ncbi:MAG: formate--tetrahydrofolate ligase, partial [Bacteroidia bacterium]
LSDYTVTEAGFGADLGAEKFLDIKCVSAGLKPSAVVIVATIKALKYHGTGDLKNLQEENVEGVKGGLENLEKHIENVKGFGLQPVVAINKFITDTDAEVEAVRAKCEEHGVKVAVAEVWAKGGEGATDLAELVAEVVDNAEAGFTPTYDWDSPVTEKIEAISKKIYGADGVEFTAQAKKDLKRIAALGLEGLPICMAKTQKSLSDNPALLGRPTGFNITVREIEVAAGAGFLVPITGDMMRMPGLPATPSAEAIDIDEEGNILGLF